MAIVSVNLDDTVNSFRTKFNQVSINQGDLATLTTIDKSSIVGAINEIYATGGGGGGGGGSVTEAFKTIQVTGTAAGTYGSTDLIANLAEDTLVFVGGAGIDVTTDPGRDEIKIDLEDLGSDPEGSYTGGISAVTVDAYGRVTAITGSAGYTGATGTVSEVTAGNGLNGGTITSSGTISIDSAQIVTLINANSGDGTVTQVTAGNGLNGGTITSSGTISIDSAQVLSKIVQPNSINNLSEDATPSLGGNLDVGALQIQSGSSFIDMDVDEATSLSTSNDVVISSVQSIYNIIDNNDNTTNYWGVWSGVAPAAMTTDNALLLLYETDGSLKGSGPYTRTVSSVADSAEIISAALTAGTDFFRVVTGYEGKASDAGFVALEIADNGNEPIYVRQYSGGLDAFAPANLSKEIALLDASGNTVLNNTQVSGGLYVGNGTSAYAQDEIRAEGNITAFYSSDATMKMNINPLQNALDKVKSISGVNFDWTDEVVEKRGGEDGYFVRKKDVGVIAQEIQKVLPEVVAERKDGTLAVRYEGIVPLLIEAIKELSDKVKSLEGK